MSSVKMRCSYCGQAIDDDDSDYLECVQCDGYVQIKCLRHASTPGDLLGDVFFNFTCAKCMELQYQQSHTATGAPPPPNKVIREKFVRQRLPWLMVITLALHNLTIKSKGLSRHGYFHWRSHIVSFINKNWDYLFHSSIRKRRNWIGSVSGNLSHNSPKFFLSGQEVFNEAGWWKLTHANLTPRAIHDKYVQLCQKRAQIRTDKRQQADDGGDASDTSLPVSETKRMRRCTESDEESINTDSCSRTIPYMGRKPKVAKQLNIVDDDMSKNLQQQQPLSTVQSSLMDFLAENLANDDLNMFTSLPNIVPEPLVGVGKDDFLPLLEAAHNEHTNLFDEPELKDTFGLNGYELTTPQESMQGKLKGFYMSQQQPLQQQQTTIAIGSGSIGSGMSTYGNDDDSNFLQEDSLHTPSEYSNDAEDDEEFQPRIVQVTNFQQLDTPIAAPTFNEAALSTNNEANTLQNGKKIKDEIKSDAEQTDDEEATAETQDAAESISALPVCKPSLFTKHTRRKWPWLLEENDVDQTEVAEEEGEKMESNENLTMMSEYEEKQLLHKLRKIFALEQQCQLEIPAYIRRFYRKLCVREWKRAHGKPVFNLDEQLNESPSMKRAKQNAKTEIIDRYQLITLSTSDARKSFYARIAGASQYELFESPYTQRILHPFIYRNKQCFPSWLKLMCEVQHAVSGHIPQRSTIDFCYVRPHHIAAVNALLQTVFWPGIDMSECLSYPDFSVVALYKKLVVGCGFLVPDVGFNEAYISFMAVRPGWQRAGIGTFMLYHLIQTCMSKDITLHVSATNPAVVLYQKFGFKIEEVILDFYEKYMPIDSKDSRHAFFLRLMR